MSANLPEEIISDILVRLPLKSIGRSRCVCKPWLSLLTSYEFIKAHLAQHSQSLAHEQKLLVHNHRSLLNITLPLGGNHFRKLKFFDKKVRSLVGSCNGLALVVTRLNVLCLINCLTQEYVKLPDLSYPHTFTSAYGFGYDSLSDDYKIVSISARRNDKANTFVDIYSLKMRSWRRIGTYPYDYDTLNDKSGVFVNGALHWTRSQFSDNEEPDNEEPPIIVAFDLSCEKFNDIPAPASIDDAFIFAVGVLMVIDGCLGIAVERNLINVFTEIWLMKSYPMVESWTKIVINVEFKNFWYPHYFHEGKLLFETADGNFKSYHLQDGRVDECLVDRDVHLLLNGITYSESLVSPHFNSQN